jgi:hypothetical protein
LGSAERSDTIGGGGCNNGGLSTGIYGQASVGGFPKGFGCRGGPRHELVWASVEMAATARAERRVGSLAVL